MTHVLIFVFKLKLLLSFQKLGHLFKMISLLLIVVEVMSIVSHFNQLVKAIFRLIQNCFFASKSISAWFINTIS